MTACGNSEPVSYVLLETRRIKGFLYLVLTDGLSMVRRKIRFRQSQPSGTQAPDLSLMAPAAAAAPAAP